MKRLSLIAICLAFLVSDSSFAGFGGSRSGGYSSGRSSFSSSGRSSFSSGRSSYSSGGRSSFFGGSRSSGSPATITRPAPRYQAPIGGGGTTVINNGGGGGGSGFFSGMLWGSLLGHHPAPVVVAPGAVGGVYGPGGGAVVMDSGYSWFSFILWSMLGIGMIVFVFLVVKRLIEED